VAILTILRQYKITFFLILSDIIKPNFEKCQVRYKQLPFNFTLTPFSYSFSFGDQHVFGSSYMAVCAGEMQSCSIDDPDECKGINI
jgi:hypothetical protein